jgi:perosamine synthetase
MKNTWRFTQHELDYIREVLDSGFGSSTSGSMNMRLEQAFAKKCGVRFAVSSNSGTSTLHSALAALDVGPGDEIITSPLSVISNGFAIIAQNAIPIFADVNPKTFNIDPEDVRRKISSKTKAIMPVSIYGLSADLGALMDVAKEHSIKVVNDAAQAFSAEYEGEDIARRAHITSYSLENSKHITTGEGGLLVTDDENLALGMRKHGCLGYASISSGDGRVRLNKDNFQNPEYARHDAFGYNYRMPEVAAAMGLAQVERMDFFIELRTRIAKLYFQAIEDVPWLVPQHVPRGYHHTYWCFPVLYERDDVSWQEFRQKYVEFGGDGIYACWRLIYQEPIFATGAFRRHAPFYYEHISYPQGLCPVAEKLQPRLMQFVNNYGSVEEAMPKVDALVKTIDHFGR